MFVDLDFKDTPEAEACARLENCPCRPSIVIHSGGGLHGYWLLREPFDLNTEADLAKLLLRRLAAHLGGDMAAAECARILRVPGTLNQKYTSAATVTVESFDPTRRYNPIAFDEWLSAVDVYTATSAPVSLAKPIRAGRRNTDLYKIGRGLKMKQLAPGMIASTLRTLNAEQCKPPLSRDELETLIRHVLEQPDQQPDPQRSTRCREHAETPAQRTITLTSASAITVRPVRWVDDNRLAAGTLGLLGGREGVGKSLYAATQVLSITRGTLPGVYHGTPRAVIVVATEDSWEYTIVPRLMAAGADLDLVYRVNVVTAEGIDTTFSLPCDLVALERVVREVQAVFILLDPLISRLDPNLDMYKDAEVRLALEPLVKLAETADAHVEGIIHVNKGSSTDPLTLLMGSRALAAVARSVLFDMTDPEDETVRLLGQPKNNLGRTDLPTRSFRIVGENVAETDEGPVRTGRLEWLGESDRSITEAVDAAATSVGDRTATTEAVDWLRDYLTDQGTACASAVIKDEGKNAGHSVDALKRARQRLRITSESLGFPRRTYWQLPQWEHARGGVYFHCSNCTHWRGEAEREYSSSYKHTVGAVSAVSAVG